MQKKTYTILGKDVTVEFDENVFYCEMGYLDDKTFPYCCGGIKCNTIGDRNTPYGLLNAKTNKSDFENWLCSTILNHKYFRGKEDLSGESTFYDLFSGSNIINFSKKTFPQFTFEGVNGLSGMFKGCNFLKIADLSDLWTPSIKEINNMFASCERLEKVDFSGWDFSTIAANRPKVVDFNDSNIFRCGESISPVLSTIVLRNCRGPLGAIVEDIVEHAVVREFARIRVKSAKDFEKYDIGRNIVDKSSFISGKNRSDVTTIIVSADRYLEVITFVEKYLEIVNSKYSRYSRFGHNAFTIKDLRKLVRVAVPNGELNSETTALLVGEIRDKFRAGMSEREVYSSLKSGGRSDYEIVCAMADISEGYSTNSLGNDLISAYCKKVVIPQITKVLHPGSAITVGQVVEELYKKYPRNLVNQAMVLYTWEMCPSIVE